MKRFCFSRVKRELYPEIAAYRQEMLLSGSSFDGCGSLEKYEDIEKWDLNLQLFERKDTVPPGYSIGYQYLYLLDKDVVGMLNFRPEALSNPFLKMYGGHIGYSIRPKERNKGIGTSMLQDFLPICRNYGLTEILITCLKENEASRRVILNNGGIFDADVYYPPAEEYLERYWIRL